MWNLEPQRRKKQQAKELEEAMRNGIWIYILSILVIKTLFKSNNNMFLLLK